MKKWLQRIVFVTLMSLLSACGSMYPAYEESEQMYPDEAQLATVQEAVNAFRAETGVLPIKDSELDTDIFIKYQIDFSKLIPKYMAKSPANAYEQGGLFQYVIWDPEKNPTVKLVDLRVPEKMRDINIRAMSQQYPQFGEMITDHIYKINFKNLGYDSEITVQSPYSDNRLPLVLSAEGNMYVDYTVDLQLYLQEKNIKATPGEDIRMIIAEDNILLPAYSLPYTVNEKNEVTFMYDPIADREAKKLRLQQEQELKKEQSK